MLIDIQGRTIDHLRISVTDRCDFRCAYCWPPHERPRAEADLLATPEIERIAAIAVGLGVRKVRITGGEPLLRPDLPALVGRLARLPGLRDLSITTNGSRLAAMAGRLAGAGLRRINLSLDSLDRGTFLRIAGRDALDRTLAGLEAARRAFPGPIKVSCVVLRGLNDREVLDFVALARRERIEVRFIEFMPLDGRRSWSPERLVPGTEIRARIEDRFPLVPDPEGDARTPSRDFVFADGAGGKVGFIDPVTRPFCRTCDRLRLTADGKLRTCLFSVTETDLRGFLRGGADDRAIAEAIRDAVWAKEAGHRINRPDFAAASRTMSEIGG